MNKIKFLMNRKKLVIYIIGIGAMFFLLTFFVSANLIGDEAENRCKIAQKEYRGDCVETLMKLIEDETVEYGEKNSAVWALGQLGDKRALLFLQKYYTGYDNNHRIKYDEAISQYELYKAIKLLDDGFNATAFIWR
ncbi:MAG: hypothetical protein KAS78_04645 [Candidatus Pacebacteria bacterium]|nr:hypothetical protein [Candidatus Paceibacterota bacterium]